jgi:hypothetical protein
MYTQRSSAGPKRVRKFRPVVRAKDKEKNEKRSPVKEAHFYVAGYDYDRGEK